MLPGCKSENSNLRIFKLADVVSVTIKTLHQLTAIKCVCLLELTKRNSTVRQYNYHLPAVFDILAMKYKGDEKL